MINVFVYGSLLFAEIAEGLCQQKLHAENAVLFGFARHAIKGADYPAIIRSENSKVNGKVLLNLDEKAMEILTFYEDNDYELVPVKVELNSGSIDAVVYVWTGGNEFLEPFDWDAEQFRKESLEFYRDEVVPSTLREFYG
ncbi:gamma-glutamylcyclotransferase family protein [Draconibacterium sp. IB214405]|uniref:gamma-glutamylcyclotransferase family protein n=1 Tax=Draconibacterium sp. IB214405 TaxID=3097352 RepID=UPI002A105DC4|nr:gamma-glutamylcyclotransferase family protein [Draconibacterium sp. IB214405]MDX8341575.1 gamma-glutamylcyclotransferase family protein [Draconibacterium sp. IB214405]